MCGRPTPSGPTPALELRDVSVWEWDERSGRVPVLAGLDLRVGRGERWVVVGPNGAGKTTLLQLAGGRRHPSRGEVRILGQRVGRVDLRELRARVGHVDGRAAGAVPPRRPCLDVVLGGVTGTWSPLPGRVTAAQRERARELLARFGCAHVAGRPFGACSHGERRRVLLARALVADPPLLLLDEPASGLDLPGREALVAALDALAPGLTLVCVTHHLEEVPPSASHALLLRDGRVVAAGAVDDVLAGGPLSACFGVPVRVRRHRDGRWSARATPGWTRPGGDARHDGEATAP